MAKRVAQLLVKTYAVALHDELPLMTFHFVSIYIAELRACAKQQDPPDTFPLELLVKFSSTSPLEIGGVWPSWLWASDQEGEADFEENEWDPVLDDKSERIKRNRSWMKSRS